MPSALAICRRPVRNADVAHVPLLHRGIQRRQRLFDRRRRIEAVQLVEIDMIELQAAQALFHAAHDVIAGAAARVHPAVPVSPNTLVATTTFSRGIFRFFNA